MRRGRIFIYLALIVIIIVGAGAFYLLRRPSTSNPPPVATVVTPQVRYVGIVTAGQNISPGTVITENMLSTIQIPEDKLVQGLYTDMADVVNMYAKYSIIQGVPITDSMVSVSPGNVNLPGSSWAPYIPEGLTALSIPITRLSSAAYGIRDGDYVDVIVTMFLVDVDPSTQSILPNNIAGLSINAPAQNTTSPLPADTQIISITQGNVTQGHFDVDQIPTDPPTNMLLYVQPSEAQRPRLVTQMIMQNIQVLHTGTFPLPGETTNDQLNGTSAATPTPLPPNATPVAPVIVPPNIITVMVSPQDAVMLTYLLYSGAQINLSLRNPNDTTPITQPDAAMLEYLLTQYNIPVPAKLPYATQPRMDTLQPTAPSGGSTSP